MNYPNDGCASCALHDKSMKGECPDDPNIPGKVRVYFPLGEHIYEEGAEITGVYCLDSGKVALLKQENETDAWVVAVIASGDTLGMPDILEGKQYRTSAVALEDSTACFIPASEMRALLLKNPSIMVRMLQQVCRRIQTLEERIEEHAAIDDDNDALMA